MPDASRDASALVTLAIGTTVAAPATATRPDLAAARGAATVSTRVFHAAHDGHCPAHFGDAAPHCWQRYVVRATGTVVRERPTRPITAALSVDYRPARAGWRFAGGDAFSIVRVPSGPTSTVTVSPAEKLAWSIRSASASSIWFWISRRNGRAP